MKPRKKRRNGRDLVAELMAEPCIYGGLLATRAEVYRDLQELRGPNGEALPWLAVDRHAWMVPTATPEEVEELTAHGLTMANLRARTIPGLEGQDL